MSPTTAFRLISTRLKLYLLEDTLEKYQHRLELQVRDYECDIQGIVNNAIYQNYLEHARHQFLLSKGVDFIDLSSKGIDLVVVRIELDYKLPLRPDDGFWVGSNIEKISKIKIGFNQSIYRLKDERLVLQAKVIGAAIDNAGKPCRTTTLDSLFD